MKSLGTIQKTFRVFQILAKIAFVFSIVGASACALGALCTMTWYNGGQVFSLFGQPIIAIFESSDELRQACAALYCDTVILTTDAILFGLAGQYFRIEQADGTPFSENGARVLKRLGIHCIWIPIVAAVITSVITEILGTERGGDVSNLPGVAIGLVLILSSLIFRYGAELEEGKRRQISDGEK